MRKPKDGKPMMESKLELCNLPFATPKEKATCNFRNSALFLTQF